MQHTNTARTVSEATASGAVLGAVLGGLGGSKEDARNGAKAGAAVGAVIGLVVADIQGGFAKKEKDLRSQIDRARKQAATLKRENDRLLSRIRKGVATRDDYRRQAAAALHQ